MIKVYGDKIKIATIAARIIYKRKVPRIEKVECQQITKFKLEPKVSSLYCVDDLR